MAITKHVKHIRSSVADSIPTTEQLDYGEIAINYSTDKERLFIKNANNEIVPFYSGKVIEENEQVTAAALTDLDSRINDIEENNVNTENMESVTYSELKSKRDNGELVPGKHYRITDYVTTTSQENTQSAGHQFDVVVLALDESTLSENAHAMQHDSDTYFSTNSADIGSWELKYCIDNDTDRFAWADSVNGKGVIYYMKDEWNNECPYDFKNIQFKRWAITDITSSTLSGDALNELKNTYVFSSNGGKHFAAKNADGNWIPSSQGITITVDENSFGWYYTFNGMSSENGETVNETYDVSTHHFKVTQDCIDYIINEDGSGLNTQDICFDNKVLEFMQEYIGDDLYSKGRYVLNNIVFINGLSFCYYNEEDEYCEFSTAECYGNVFKSNCNSNTFGNNCRNNTFGNNAYGNTFGNECYNNSFGNDCWNNTFGNDCWNNTFGNSVNRNSFGNSVNRNTFGNNCRNNTFGNNCASNTFWNNCDSNSFGNNCDSNSFGNYFQSNSFGNNAYGNTFGNNCASNRLGNDCRNNTFGNSCISNTLGNNCWYNTFGNNFHFNSFGNSCSSNTFGNDCVLNTFGNVFQYNTFGNNVIYFNSEDTDYIRWIIVENGNSNITLVAKPVTSPNAYLQNIKIAQGTNNAASESGRKTIIHTTTNDGFSTIYQNADSQVISV